MRREEKRKLLTVSAPPEYRLDAAHLISSSSSGDTLRPSSKFVTKLGSAVPLACNKKGEKVQNMECFGPTENKF